MPAAADLSIVQQNRSDTPLPSAARETPNGKPHGESLTDWLAWLAELLPESPALALLRTGDAGQCEELARFPQDGRLSAAAMPLARRAVLGRQCQRLSQDEPARLLLALPVSALDVSFSARAVLVLDCRPLSDRQQGSLVGLCTWALKSASWLSAGGVATDAADAVGAASDTASDDTVRTGFELPEAIATLDAAALVNLLARQLPETLCVLHRLRRRSAGRMLSRVLAISDQTRLDRRSDRLEDMNRIVESVWSGPGTLESGAPVDLPMARIAELTGRQSSLGELAAHAVSLLPFQFEEQQWVLGLYWQSAQRPDGFDPAQWQRSLLSAVHMASAVEERRLPLHTLVMQRIGRSWHQTRIRSRNGLPRRALLCLLPVLILVLFLMPVDKEVAADLTVEAAERHALIAPMDGHLRSVHARAGDVVSSGDLLATLGAEDLYQQLEKWQAEERKNQQDYLGALALHDRVEQGVLREQQVLIRAELDQVRARLARHELRAPVDGMVLSESVSDALGSAVESGSVLYEIGSADERRLSVQVPERHISAIRTGQILSLRLSADPAARGRARVDTIVPVATADQGRSWFKVHATPLDGQLQLRPGMKGVGRIQVGQEPLLLQWWGGLRDRLTWLAWKAGWLA